MQVCFRSALLFIIPMIFFSGCSGLFSPNTVNYEKSSRYENVDFSPRKQPMKVTTESEHALREKDYIKIGEVSSKVLVKECESNETDCVVKIANPQAHLLKTLSEKSSSAGGDNIVLSTINDFKETEEEKTCASSRNIPDVMLVCDRNNNCRNQNIMRSECVLYETHITEVNFFASQTATVWRYDPDRAQAWLREEQAREAARLQEEQAREAVRLKLKQLEDYARKGDVENIRNLLKDGKRPPPSLMRIAVSNCSDDLAQFLMEVGSSLSEVEDILEDRLKDREMGKKAIGNNCQKVYQSLENSRKTFLSEREVAVRKKVLQYAKKGMPSAVFFHARIMLADYQVGAKEGRPEKTEVLAWFQKAANLGHQAGKFHATTLPKTLEKCGDFAIEINTCTLMPRPVSPSPTIALDTLSNNVGGEFFLEGLD